VLRRRENILLLLGMEACFFSPPVCSLVTIWSYPTSPLFSYLNNMQHETFNSILCYVPFRVANPQSSAVIDNEIFMLISLFVIQ
jgi:hypothetical protein